MLNLDPDSEFEAYKGIDFSDAKPVSEMSALFKLQAECAGSQITGNALMEDEKETVERETVSTKRKKLNQKAYCLLNDLSNDFPLSFGKRLPLEVGILQKIEAFLKEKQGESFDSQVLTRALYIHCGHLFYLNNLKAKGSKRVNLEGVEVEDVTDEQRADALEKVKAILKRRKEEKERAKRRIEQEKREKQKAEEKAKALAKQEEQAKPAPIPAKQEESKDVPVSKVKAETKPKPAPIPVKKKDSKPVPVAKAKAEPKQVQVIVKKRRVVVKPDE